MIWNPDRQGTPGTPVEVIAAELAALCGGLLEDDGYTLHAVAVAVDAVMSEDSPAGVVPSIAALAAKALLSIGEPRAARRLALLDAGIIRPAASRLAGDAPLWVVDLRRLAVHAEAMLELQLLGSLDAVMECMADVWDDVEGRGVMGLQHLGDAVGDGRGRRGRRPDAGATDWVTACSARLKVIGARRGWREVPTVLALDAAEKRLEGR